MGDGRPGFDRILIGLAGFSIGLKSGRDGAISGASSVPSPPPRRSIDDHGAGLAEIPHATADTGIGQTLEIDDVRRLHLLGVLRETGREGV